MKTEFSGFPPEALRFFRQLKRNNSRAWFLAHKEIYDQKVKLPMIGLIRALESEMSRFALEIDFDPARNVYRIYRDVRFSADKSPYKTQIAASFNPRGIPRHSGAGLYFHISAEDVLIAGGVYMPGPKELLAIRTRIASHHEELLRIVRQKEFKRLFGGLEGEQLSRAPKGFPPDHPAIDLLRYKQFLAFATLPPSLAVTPRLLPTIIRLFRAMMPLVRYLNAPLSSSLPLVSLCC